jgi:hypothetical protein
MLDNTRSHLPSASELFALWPRVGLPSFAGMCSRAVGYMLNGFRLRKRAATRERSPVYPNLEMRKRDFGNFRMAMVRGPWSRSAAQSA